MIHPLNDPFIVGDDDGIGGSIECVCLQMQLSGSIKNQPLKFLAPLKE